MTDPVDLHVLRVSGQQTIIIAVRFARPPRPVTPNASPEWHDSDWLVFVTRANLIVSR
jgi:hypothetical protein